MNLRRKESGIWVLDYDQDGKRARLSTGTRDYNEAKRIAKEIVMGVRSPADRPTAAKETKAITMEDLFRHMMLTHWRDKKSQATIRSNVGILETMIGDVEVSRMNTVTLQKVVDHMLKDQYAPGTIKRKMDAIMVSLKVATRWDGGTGTGRPLLTTLPDRPPLEVRNLRDRILLPKEEEAVFAAIAARTLKEPTRDWVRFGVLIRFLLDTGCRLGEALALVEDRIVVRNDRTWVTFPIYTTKNDKARTLPLTRELEAELPKALARRIDERVFPIRPATCWWMWDNIRGDVEKAGLNIEDVNLHTLRHTCITRLASQVPIQKVALWAGHSDISVTMKRYGHLQTHDLLSCVESLDS
jgi:integrase